MTTSDCTNIFYISATMYLMMPGTIFNFHQEILHHSEVPRGTSNYATFLSAIYFYLCLNPDNLLINTHREMRLKMLKTVS